MTKTQWTTLVLCGVYLIWEIVVLAGWKAATTGPHIRIDLLILYPVLAVLIGASIWQIARRRK